MATYWILLADLWNHRDFLFPQPAIGNAFIFAASPRSIWGHFRTLVSWWFWGVTSGTPKFLKAFFFSKLRVKNTQLMVNWLNSWFGAFDGLDSLFWIPENDSGIVTEGGTQFPNHQFQLLENGRERWRKPTWWNNGVLCMTWWLQQSLDIGGYYIQAIKHMASPNENWIIFNTASFLIFVGIYTQNWSIILFSHFLSCIQTASR